MKRIFLIFIGCFIGLFLTELFFRFIIKFPVYNIEYKVHGTSKMRDLTNIYRPHAKYWSIEAGNKVFTRNNLGLPGIDIDTSSGSKYIYILGNSYIEALPVKPQENPVSVFQSEINNSEMPYQAINLAYSGQDPYSLYFRSRYFEKYYPPKYVILLINWDYPILHNDILNFSIPEDFGVRDNNFKTHVADWIRNNSSLIEIIAKSLNKLTGKTNEDSYNKITDLKRNKLSDEDGNYSGIEMCIDNFNATYKGKFLCIYFGHDTGLERALFIHCNKGKIPYFFKDIWAIKGVNKVGHLNKLGCKNLGDMIYESFCKFFQ